MNVSEFINIYSTMSPIADIISGCMDSEIMFTSEYIFSSYAVFQS